MPSEGPIDCPICGGRGTVRCQPSPHRQQEHRCGACGATCVVDRRCLSVFRELRSQMMKVADAIQGGRADDAAQEARRAARLARELLNMTCFDEPPGSRTQDLVVARAVRVVNPDIGACRACHGARASHRLEPILRRADFLSTHLCYDVRTRPRIFDDDVTWDDLFLRV